MKLNIEWKIEELDNEIIEFLTIERIFHYTLTKLYIENWKAENIHGVIYLASEDDAVKIWFRIN